MSENIRVREKDKLNYPSKVGGWTNSDLDLIADNLRSLKQSTGLSDSDLREIFSTKSRQERNKKNLLGHWCSQGLSVTRDPCEVFQKLKLMLVREARMEADLVPSPEAHERLELNNSPEYKLLF